MSKKQEGHFDDWGMYDTGLICIATLVMFFMIALGFSMGYAWRSDCGQDTYHSDSYCDGGTVGEY